MAVQRVILTYADYEALPNDGRIYEIHEGELSVTPAPGSNHQLASGSLFVALYLYVKAHGLGKVLDAPIDVILGEFTIVQPDLVFLDNSRLSFLTPRGIEGIPTLIIEILSPSTARTDRTTKLQLYARHGVPHYWIVDPEARVIEAFSLSRDGYELTARAAGTQTFSAPPFTDLALDLATIWP